MADFQPKIYSLSILNVRQHFSCDYRFHEFRTDFSGESGSGKSLIADFIQLLLVGSSVFKSGTEGVKPRDTSGLVLKGAGSKYGRGYILVNVELQSRNYITLGGYLETSSSQMQFFIIQAGYDFEETLVPMNQPIFYRDLLVNGKIEPLDSLQKSFLEKGYLKAVNNKKYHQLLFNNGILAVDLSHSRQSLKSYAAIIRSFSRGKGFFTDSDALKTFLFGDDDQKQLIEKYREEVQNINVDQQQHQRLLEEIATIKIKEQKIENVLRDFNAYHKLKLQFSCDNASFWFLAHENASKDEASAKQQYQNAAIRRLLINQKLFKIKLDDILSQQQSMYGLRVKLRNSGQQSEKLKSEVQRTKDLLDQSTKYKDIIDIVNKWFTEDIQDLNFIRQWHLAERTKVNDAEVLKNFEQFLSENQLSHDFKQSDWFNDYAQAGKLSMQKLEIMEADIARQKTQLVFSDLDNPNSLAHWALQHLTLPLSLEQESMLIHFQPLSRTAPATTANRYLPFPERLFQKPITVKTVANGFWLELNGIYEFINYIKKQYLNVPIDQIYLDHAPLQALQQQLEELTLKYQRSKTLKEKLDTYPALEKAIILYKTSQTELFPDIDEIAQLTPAELERHISVFEASEHHIAKYESNKKVYDEAFANNMNSQNTDKTVQEQISKIEDYVKKQYYTIDFDGLLSENEKQLHIYETELGTLMETENIAIRQLQKQEAEIAKISSSLNKIYEMALIVEKDYHEAKRHFDEKQNYNISSLSKLNDARSKFIEDHHRDFDFNQDLLKIEHAPDETASADAGSDFRASYKVASEDIEDKTILRDFSVGILAHKLLPTVFPTHQIQEELIGEQIEKRLTEMTNDLQRIGSRKIEILHNVFNEVQNVYNEYLTKVQKINNYLRSKDRQITGGNYATLQHKSAAGYPDDWMKIFRKRLTNEMQNIGIFAPNNKQDIDEIMISVFRDSGGTREATVPDLLNPRSYFDLLFEIKLEDGQSNSGSNGQTYTANALLCLARLSLIENNDRSGIRIMPIDEAEGLGSNYEMLHALAKKENYQIVTMSIETAGDINDDGQYIYILHDNKDATGSTYVPPLGIFHRGQLTENIDEIFEEAEL